MSSNVIDAWITAAYVAPGHSPNTVRLRRCLIDQAARSFDLLSADADTVLAYIASRRDLKPETRSAIVSTLRSFYRYAYRRDLIAADIAAELPGVKVPPAQPKPITAAALAVARARANPADLLMLDLGALAGLRRAEIARVHSDDVSDVGLHVTGKGGRARTVPIHPRLHDRLHALDGWAFPSPQRPGEHLCADRIARRLERILPPPWTAHSLRHYFASAAYAGTRDLRSVQTLLGHASIETTQRYVAVSNDDLAHAVRAVA